MITKKQNVSKKIVKNLYYDDDQRRLAKLVTGFSFEMFIMGVILANAVVLGLMTSPTMDFYYGNLLYLLDRVFMGIFIVEMLLKIIALKKKFFKSHFQGQYDCLHRKPKKIYKLVSKYSGHEFNTQK